MIERIGVVIPARDEEMLIGRCLASVLMAAGRTRATVDITVVADGCLDRTAELARRFLGVRVLELESSNVGTARAAGARAAIAAGADWIANTDADSVVPANWIALQLELAASGADVVVGTVRPEFAELSPAQVLAWEKTHEPGIPNGHVHGANLGVRTSAYLIAGGYRPLPEHEDADLVRRLEGFSIVATADAEVVTSGRAVGRTPGGYARYLRENLVADAEAEAATRH